MFVFAAEPCLYTFFRLICCIGEFIVEAVYTNELAAECFTCRDNYIIFTISGV